MNFCLPGVGSYLNSPRLFHFIWLCFETVWPAGSQSFPAKSWPSWLFWGPYYHWNSRQINIIARLRAQIWVTSLLIPCILFQIFKCKGDRFFKVEQLARMFRPDSIPQAPADLNKVKLFRFPAILMTHQDERDRLQVDI